MFASNDRFDSVAECVSMTKARTHTHTYTLWVSDKNGTAARSRTCCSPSDCATIKSHSYRHPRADC